ncbi:unnamed protein product [Lactuca saligna]|uniref:Uncharacterized protein n=1 Tax=Lactuca saligna TaxID=75948 RepID=A0AA36DZ88_LACSI|nr:unnamed protein product [Lactuca saligna]
MVNRGMNVEPSIYMKGYKLYHGKGGRQFKKSLHENLQFLTPEMEHDVEDLKAIESVIVQGSLGSGIVDTKVLGIVDTKVLVELFSMYEEWQEKLGEIKSKELFIIELRDLERDHVMH